MIQFKNEHERRELLDCLNENMNEEFRATLQYICHRISARHGHEVLSESFKSAALDEMAHILFFSDLLEKCGGQARFTDWPIDKSEQVQDMLKSDIALEQNARDRYRKQLVQFGGLPGITAVLESVLADEMDHEELFAKYLEKL